MEDCSRRLKMGEPGLTEGLCDTMVSPAETKGAMQAHHASARAILLPPGGVPQNTLFNDFN